MVYNLLRLATFTKHNTFEIHPDCFGYQHFLPFSLLSSILLYGYTTFVHWRPFGLFLAVMNRAARCICVQVFVGM